MAAYKTNRLVIMLVIFMVVILVLLGLTSLSHSGSPRKNGLTAAIKNNASKDSAAESLDTLTVEVSQAKRSIDATQKQLKTVIDNNEVLKTQNQRLQQQFQEKKGQTTDALSKEIAALKSQLATSNTTTVNTDNNPIKTESSAQPITTVPEISAVLNPKSADKKDTTSTNAADKKPLPVPYYTIPANATSVHDRLMTALVGRIPIKGVVMDPYPFKIVFSDDTLAASGLRVPNLKQMIVSGYTEGDLNLSSVRGWVTSLTFVFNDGTIVNDTSNDNNIGKFTKDDALGYLSDPYGNPFIRGKLITNAPAYLSMSVALGAAQGAANAYAQSQTTSNSTLVGTNTSSVTGSSGAYVAGQAVGNATSQVAQWWHDREEQSFDAIYVPTEDEKSHQPTFIAVNFTKEIRIDYDPEARKVVYSHSLDFRTTSNLD